MPFDDKGFAETKADPLTLGALIAWLETMPADGRYCYTDNGFCLLGQYFSASGVQFLSVGARTWTDVKWHEHSLSRDFADIAVYRPHTFGGALWRARHIRRRRKVFAWMKWLFG